MSEVNVWGGEGDRLAPKVLNIGDWDMLTVPAVAINHGLDYTKIQSISASIIEDSLTPVRDINMLNGNETDWSGVEWNATQIILRRATLGAFNTSNYNQTSFNRGYILIWYLV